MKKILIMFLVAAVAFTGCNSDDDDDNNNNPPATKKIDKLEIRGVSWTDNQGNTWDDDGTGPDMQIKFGPASQPAKYLTEIQSDRDPRQGATIFNLDPDISTTKENWTFTLWDIDNFGDDRVMYTWTHDFSTTPSNTVDKQQGEWFLRIHLKD